MSLRPTDPEPIPAETARVARAAFPKGTAVMHLRDELGPVYEDQTFADLFSRRGKPAEAPWRLALVTVLQFAENLTDRQAADAVRSRIDWKYALGLALTDDGFDYSVLSKFRARLLAGEAEQQLLDVLVARCQEQGLVKAGGRARTDSTHVLAAVRTLNRLECVGETLRATLNDLAVVAPDWLRARVGADWFDRYGARFEAYRLPKGEAERQALAEAIGRDGFVLLTAIFAEAAPAWLREVPIVEVLRRTWVYQYWLDDGVVRWRKGGELAPAGVRLDSPDDPEAHFGNKRTTTWTGYKVHLTETCDPEQLHLITHVDTTLAAVSDVARTADIHDALAGKALLPREHLVDAGYVDGPLLVSSRSEHGIALVGPVRPNVSWQAKAEGAYDIAAFTVEWAAQRVICPQGRVSTAWVPHEDQWGNQVISAKFAREDCLRCGHRACCTRSATAPRHLTFRPEAEHEALQRVRQEPTTADWQARYDGRAGIEGTLSQGIRAFGLRRCRYLGLAKTRLQHLATGAALNVARIAAWAEGRPHAPTRVSRFAALAA
ncbi:MAG: IS1182 family transposase [Chloroflexota bacterium]|nr:IS1182 family transposase [Chloroflexota bacterium]